VNHCKPILKLALPMCGSSILMLLGNLINLRNVGMHQPHNLYLLALYLPVTYLLLAIFEAMRVCGVYLLIQKKQDPRRSLLNIIFLLWISIVILLLLFQVSYGWFIAAFELNASDASDFYRFTFAMIGLGAIGGAYYILTSGLYALSRGRLAIILNVLTTVVGCLVTYYCVRYWHLGIFSIVWGTGLSSLLFLVLLSFVFNSLLESQVKEKISWSFMKKDYQACLPVALPVFISYLVTFGGIFLFNHIVAEFGTVVLTGFSIAMRIQSIVILPAFAIGISTAIIAARSNNKKSSLHQGLLLSFCFYVLVVLVLTLISAKIVGLITVDPLIQQSAIQYLNRVVPSYMGFGLMLTWICFLEQMGQGKVALSFNFSWFAAEIILGGGLALRFQMLTYFYDVILVMNFLSILVVFLFFKWRGEFYATPAVS